MINQRRALKDKKRIVVKIGSSSITHKTGKIDFNKIDRLARQLVDLRNQGKDVVLVSSGAIAIGTAMLRFCEKPKEIDKKQAAAAVGQGALIQIYEKIFSEYQQNIAQILLTKDVIENQSRGKNAKNTFNALFELGIIPIVNENDTIATDEIVFGDNDTLSAIVAELVEADLLILLSDIEGLYTSDPNLNKNAILINHVKEITPEIEALGGDSVSGVGTGGMATKLMAAEIALRNNMSMIIANADNLKNIEKIVNGESIGTLFSH